MKINLSLNKNKHINATDVNNFQTMFFKNNVEQLPFGEISEIINSYEVYEKEKEKCEDYRLNITINPYLTNVLANKITEVIDKKSGVVVSGDGRLNLIQVIDDENYDYKIGYDIFDNYYHRMDTFKRSDDGLASFKDSTDLFDLKSIQESIKDNLIVDNGWLCFLNKVKIGGKKMFNNIEPNNKVYLYPTRDCFLFNPIKTNEGLVENWDYFLTYPHKNITNNRLTHGNGGVNGMPIIESKSVMYDDKQYIEITTLYKHNLNRGDVIKFKNGTNKTYLVYNAGGVNKDNKKCKITIDADKYDDLAGIYETLKDKRLTRIIDRTESQYYIREFKKLPKLMRESYQPGFANNVYSDPMFQIQYTDSINLEDLRDNLGRPISEIYLTILKNTVTEDENNSTYPNSDFTKLISGFDINQIEGGYSAYNIHMINESTNKSTDNTKVLEDNINSYSDTFMGDIVEYNSATCKETVLEDVHYRFNTIQREKDDKTFKYMNDTLTAHIGGITIGKEKEGYYYKSHHRIKIKEFSDTLFSSEMFSLNTCNDGVILEDSQANILTFEDVDVRDLKNGDKLRMKVKEGENLVNKSIITVSSINESENSFKTDFKLELIPESDYTFEFYKINDPSVPDYCDDANNKVLWRELKKIDNIFTNGNIYLNNIINFHLKRQDPFGEYGVRHESFPADVYGRKNKIQIIDEIVERVEDDC